MMRHTSWLVLGRARFCPRFQPVNRFLLSTLIAVLAVAALDTGHSADRDLDLGEPHFPVVQCSVTLPPDFTASDPTVIVTYSNTSDRCPAYELVPITKTDRLVLGPGISFDGADTMVIDPDLEFVPQGTQEIPPQADVSIAYRIRDQYRMPEEWSKMLVRPTSRYLLELPWFEFDASGRETRRGSDQIRSYDGFVSRAWEDPRRRERIRADIRRYAEMKAKGEPMLPRIRMPSSPTGVTGSVLGVEIVDGMVRYPPRPSAAPADPPRTRSPAPLLSVLAVLSVGALVWILLRHRKPQPRPPSSVTSNEGDIPALDTGHLPLSCNGGPSYARPSLRHGAVAFQPLEAERIASSNPWKPAATATANRRRQNLLCPRAAHISVPTRVSRDLLFGRRGRRPSRSRVFIRPSTSCRSWGNGGNGDREHDSSRRRLLFAW